ncbi:MAG TPA: DUF308 domain-containing protein [Acidimicrobiia bacterium]
MATDYNPDRSGRDRGFRGGGFPAILFGIVTGAIGILLLLHPEGSFTAFVTIIGVSLMIEGVTAIALSIMAKPDARTTG